MKSIFIFQMFAMLLISLPLTAANVWNEYENNPVLGEGTIPAGNKAYYPSVVYNEDKFSGHGSTNYYKMWYQTSGGMINAISDDGINWTDHGTVLSGAYHPLVKYFSNSFSGANSGVNQTNLLMYYRIWYWNAPTLYDISAIYYGESPDGTNWYNLQSAQNGDIAIITGVSGDWNRGSYGPCDVIYCESAPNTGTFWNFTMYYDGTTGGKQEIGLGFSSNGIMWTGYDADNDTNADPVFTGAGGLNWDSNFVGRATIIKNSEDNFEMWYSGGINEVNQGIGYAYSSNGIDWTRATNNPVFYYTDNISWRNSRTYCPAVIKYNGADKMWFAGKSDSGNYSIGYAVYIPEPACLLFILGNLFLFLGRKI